MQCNLEPIRDLALWACVMILCILVGIVTFEVSVKPQVSEMGSVIHPKARGILPLHAKFDLRPYPYPS